MTEDDKRVPGVGHQRPRSPRVPVDFSVGLDYTNAKGEPIHAQGEPLRVSRGGATIKTDIQVTVGVIVKLTPPFGRTIDAEVNGVWTDETDGLQRIGVRLLDESGWFAD